MLPVQINNNEQNQAIPPRFYITSEHFHIPCGLFKDCSDGRREACSPDGTRSTPLEPAVFSAEVAHTVRATAPVTGCGVEYVTSLIYFSTKFLICLCLRDNVSASLLGFAVALLFCLWILPLALKCKLFAHRCVHDFVLNFYLLCASHCSPFLISVTALKLKIGVSLISVQNQGVWTQSTDLSPSTGGKDAPSPLPIRSQESTLFFLHLSVPWNLLSENREGLGLFFFFLIF